MKNKLKLLPLIIIALFGVYLRFDINYDNIVTDEETIVFHGPDSYYHARRAEWISHNYPSIPYEDPYVYFPDKGIIHWPGGYDFILGSIFKCLDLLNIGQSSREWIICCFNPLFSIFNILLVFALTRRLAGSFSAHLAALFLAISPTHLFGSAFGNVDHHNMVSFAALLIAYFTLRSLERGGSRRLCRFTGILIGFSHLFHSIIGVTCGIMIASFIIFQFISGVYRNRFDLETGKKFSDIFLFAAISTFIFSMTSPFARTFALSIEQLSILHAIIPLTGFIISNIIILCIRPAHEPTRPRLIFLILSVSTLIFFEITSGLSGMLIEGLRHTSGPAMSVTLAADSKSMMHFGLRFLVKSFSFFIFIFPFYICYCIYLATKGKKYGKHSRAYSVFMLFSILTILSGILKYSFAGTASQFIAIFAGIFAGDIIDQVYKITKTRRFKKAAIIGVFTLLSIPMVYNLTKQRANGKALHTVYRFDADLLARHLKKISPETSGIYGGKPDYSVFANRDLGHAIIYRAERPVVVSPFGEFYCIDHTRDYARFALSTDPDQAKQILQKYSSKYLATRPLSTAEFFFYSRLINRDPDLRRPQTLTKIMNSRLLRFTGSAFESDNKLYKAAPYLRLEYESRSVMTAGKDVYYPRHKLFQVVPGITFRGSAKPNSMVRAAIDLRTNIGREFGFSNIAHADAQGNWELNFPYSTEVSEETLVKPLNDILLEINEKKYFVKITEKQVLDGFIMNIALD